MPGRQTRSQHILSQGSDGSPPNDHNPTRLVCDYMPGAVLPFATPICISLIPPFADIPYCEVYVTNKQKKNTEFF